ncbi:hypothetical protein CH371_10230 [Leptospira wolffii]|uniref:Uncharacterized protein n=1 Tax=Leptospira wolffii TaxID=409998 RepID=A0A2M9ZBU5_9LEPT|nr:hypothetical protein CH371_10230 [Leptospira wolffii]
MPLLYTPVSGRIFRNRKSLYDFRKLLESSLYRREVEKLISEPDFGVRSFEVSSYRINRQMINKELEVHYDRNGGPEEE